MDEQSSAEPAKTREEKIRAIAQRIWEETGRPTDQAKLHWEMAEKEFEESERDAEQSLNQEGAVSATPAGMITGDQVRVARKLLQWTQRQLADAAGTTEKSIANLESGHGGVSRRILLALRRALERSGIEFPDHETVRLQLNSGAR